MTLDLSQSDIDHIHIIGIGGAGMSAIATVLTKMGKKISGSDLKNSHVTERLESQSIVINVPHNAEVISDDIDLVVRSTAISESNEEIVAARTQGIQVVSRAEMLAAICSREKSVGIAGSHGKTTTTSMVTSIARAADMQPSFMIGGDVNEIGTNAGYHDSSLMIVEADESDKTFLELPLIGAVITNIENDHLENYGDSFDELKKSFETFARNVGGPVVICIDEPNAKALADSLDDKPDVITVGSSSDASWRYEVTDTSRGGVSAHIFHNGEQHGSLELAVPGVHNMKNAMCAYGLMNAFGVDDESCKKGLSTFGGVARRFQFRGETSGMIFVDDYAHLPTEISATLAAAQDGDFARIIAIFQPHRYSRTQSLYKEFADALCNADIVGICDIYSAGEDARPGVTGAMIADTLVENGHQSATFLPHIDDVVSFVRKNGRPGDLILTLGAGDVTMYPDVIQDQLAHTGA
jgi:UDP-N-acetylmuramate--alanine ligase